MCESAQNSRCYERVLLPGWLFCGLGFFLNVFFCVYEEKGDTLCMDIYIQARGCVHTYFMCISGSCEDRGLFKQFVVHKAKIRLALVEETHLWVGILYDDEEESRRQVCSSNHEFPNKGNTV